MSEHGHAAPGHDAHSTGHDAHGHSGHDEHGHGGHDDQGHGHEERWGDYNSQPPAPSTLPPVGALHLLVVGIGLMVLMSGIVITSLKLADAHPPEPAHHGAAHDEHKAHEKAPAHGDGHEKKH